MDEFEPGDDATVVNASKPAFQVGDIVKAINSYPGYFTQGRLYKVTNVSLLSGTVPWLDIEVCDTGRASSWAACNFQFHSASQIPTLTFQGTATAVTTGPQGVDLPAEIHFKDPEQERKERIWKALQGAAKQ